MVELIFSSSLGVSCSVKQSGVAVYVGVGVCWWCVVVVGMGCPALPCLAFQHPL